MPPHLRPAAIGLISGLLLGLVGQALPPLHVLTHELVAAVCVVGAIVLLHTAAGAWRWTPEGPDRLGQAFRATLGAVVTLPAATQAVTWLANARYGCDLQDTGLFLWVTWLPLGLLTAVMGLALGRAGRGFWSRTALLIGLALLAAGHDELQARLDVRIVDPFLGVQDWLSQRASMGLPRVHYLQRTWLLGVAMAGYATLAWRHHGTAAWRGAALWGCLAVTAATMGFGSRIGVGFGHAALYDVLDGERRTPHFVIRYDRTGRARHELDQVVRALEWELHRLSTAWKIPVDDVVISVYLFDDREALQGATGQRNAHAHRRHVTLPLRDVYDATLPHELVHAVDQEVGTPWYRLAWNRGIIEGSANAWSDGFWRYPEAHVVAAAALDQGTLPSAATVMRPFGFVEVDEGEAYRVAGSFIGWLVLTEGVERWHELMIQWDIEAVYGRSLEELDAAWRAFLADIPRDLDDAQSARHRFGSSRYPSYLQRQCPKLGETTPNLSREARDAARAGAHEDALRHYETLLDQGFDERWSRGRLAALQDLDRHAEVLAVLDSLPPAAGDDVERNRLDVRLRSLAQLGRTEAFRTVLAHRIAVAPDPEMEMIGRLVAEPALSAQILELFAGRDDAWELRPFLTGLRKDMPEHDEALEALELTWVPRLHVNRPSDRKRVLATLEGIRRHPGSCASTNLRWAANQRLTQGDCEMVDAFIDVLQVCDDALPPADVDALRERVAWERTPDPDIHKPCVETPP